MLTSLFYLQQGNLKRSNKFISIVNIEEETLHVFWTTWGIQMKRSGKMWLMIILKFTKNHSFTISQENTFFKKQQGGSNGENIVF